MAKSKTGNKGLIFGTVLGAVAGAAYAMWKTPMSGKELRSKLGTGPVNSTSEAAATQPASENGGGVVDKMMSAVEHTLAPIVGVNLGKTANNGGSGETGPINVAQPPTDIAPPAEVESAEGTPIADPAKGEAAMTTGTDTIRMKKFAWGTPAPEAEAPIQAEENAPVEPVKDATTVPAAAAVGAAETPAASGDWNTTSIRSQRFAWGDPKPQTTEAEAATPAAPAAPTAAPAVANSAGASNVDDSVVASAASVSTGSMVPFPQLGGLENK